MEHPETDLRLTDLNAMFLIPRSRLYEYRLVRSSVIHGASASGSGEVARSASSSRVGNASTDVPIDLTERELLHVHPTAQVSVWQAPGRLCNESDRNSTVVRDLVKYGARGQLERSDWNCSAVDWRQVLDVFVSKIALSGGVPPRHLETFSELRQFIEKRRAPVGLVIGSHIHDSERRVFVIHRNCQSTL